MSALILPRRFNKPQSPRGRLRLDWNNDLVQLLNPVGIWVFSEPNGIPRNLVDGRPCTKINNPSIIPGALGLGAFSPASAAGPAVADVWNTGLFPDNTWRTLVGSFAYYSAAAVNNYLCGIHDATRRFYLAQAGSVATTKILMAWGGSAAESTLTRTAPGIGTTETLGFTAEGWSAETSGVVLNRYVQGVAFDQLTGQSWTGTTASRKFYIGKRTLNSTEDGYTESGPAVLTHWIVIGRNPLSAEGHAELAARPYQMVVKDAERIHFFTASAPSGNIAASGGTTAGGSASLTGGAAGDIAASGGGTAGGAAGLSATASAAASGGTTAGGLATLTSPSTITITNSPDRGTIYPSLCSVVPNGSTPTINIVSRYVWTENASGIRNCFFEVSGVNGLTPVFDISQTDTNAWQILYSGKFWFSYTGALGSWQEFANTSDLSSPDAFRVSHSSAFTSDTVYISMDGRPWRVGDTLPWIESLESSGFISMPPSSAGADYVFETRTATTNVDPGDVIAAQPLYSFKVSNGGTLAPDGNPKRKMVFFSGVHASEDVGNHVIYGAVDFLVSTDPKAAQVRAWFDTYVYPLVAAAGRAGGTQRGDFQSGHVSSDVNRHWHDSTLETIVKHKAALAADVGSAIDVFLDWHGDHTVTNTFNYFYLTGRANNSAWDTAIKVYHPSISSGSASDNSAQWYADTALSADWSFTPEAPYKGTFALSNYHDFGANHIRALADLITAGEFGTVGGLQASGGTTAGGSATLSSSGGSSGDIAAAGGTAAGGSATATATAGAAASGGTTAGGSATLSGAAAGNLSASGGATAGGSATVSDATEGNLAALGGGVAGGSATISGSVTLADSRFYLVASANRGTTSLRPLSLFPSLVTGDDFRLFVDLTINDVAWPLDADAVVKACLVALDHRAAWSASVTLSSAAVGAAWGSGRVSVEIGAAVTAAMTQFGLALLEIQVDHAGLKESWFTPVRVVKGVIS